MIRAIQKPIGILGGTFDPIHNGHLQIAGSLYRTLNLAEIRFIPCKQPVLKSAASATPEQRLAMLQLALTETSKHFIADSRELDRQSPSYMVETLQSLTTEFPKQPLCLILGMDVFNQLPQWHRWKKILDYCHLVIVNRPQVELPSDPQLQQLLSERQIAQPKDLQVHLAGKILLMDLPPMPLSATTIRQAVAKQQPPIDLLPLSVWEYIRKHQLYQDDMSK